MHLFWRIAKRHIRVRLLALVRRYVSFKLAQVACHGALRYCGTWLGYGGVSSLQPRAGAVRRGSPNLIRNRARQRQARPSGGARAGGSVYADAAAGPRVPS